MKYLQEYKKFFSSILDPLERLDDLEVNLEDLDTHSTDHEAYYDTGQISREEFELEAKELKDFFNWGKKQISILQKEYADQIKERKKKAWPGHERLPFPVVWNRKSYNRIEPEIKKAGPKSQWIDWLLQNLTEGNDEYWQYEDRVLNAAQLDIAYYIDFQGESFSVSSLCSRISNNFVVFLFNSQKVLELKTGVTQRSPRPKNPYKQEFNELDKLILRTMKKRIKSGEKLTWNFVRNDLRLHTNEDQTVMIRDVSTKDDTMAPGILLYTEGLSEPAHKLLQSTFQKKLSHFRKLLLLE